MAGVLGGTFPLTDPTIQYSCMSELVCVCKCDCSEYVTVCEQTFLATSQVLSYKTLILSMCTSKHCLPIEGRYNSNTLDMFSI